MYRFRESIQGGRQTWMCDPTRRPGDGQKTGTNKQPWGPPPPGSGLVRRAVLTRYSISQVREPIRQDAGKMVSGTDGLSLLS